LVFSSIFPCVVVVWCVKLTNGHYYNSSSVISCRQKKKIIYLNEINIVQRIRAYTILYIRIHKMYNLCINIRYSELFRLKTENNLKKKYQIFSCMLYKTSLGSIYIIYNILNIIINQPIMTNYFLCSIWAARVRVSIILLWIFVGQEITGCLRCSSPGPLLSLQCISARCPYNTILLCTIYRCRWILAERRFE